MSKLLIDPSDSDAYTGIACDAESLRVPLGRFVKGARRTISITRFRDGSCPRC